jgi:hypothetical protein
MKTQRMICLLPGTRVTAVTDTVWFPNSKASTYSSSSVASSVSTLATPTPLFLANSLDRNRNYSIKNNNHNNYAPYSLTVRSFSKKKGKGGGGGGGGGAGGGGGNTKMLKVYEVYSDDVEEVREVFREDDFMEIAPGGKDMMKQLRNAVAMDPDDPDTQVKIFNSKTKQFEILKDVEQVKREAQANQGRIALAPDFPDEDDYPGDGEYSDDDEDYRDEDDEAEYQDEEYDDDDDDDILGGRVRRQERLMSLLRYLKENGWQRQPNEPGMLINTNTSQIQSTKNIILQLANEDNMLQEFLVSEIGGLDHLVTCVDFDFVWEDLPKRNSDNDDEPQEATFKEK